VLVVLNHDLNRVKNGFAARSRELGLSAHGQSPDLARRNMERLVLLYLQPFRREGTLEQEVRQAGLQVDNDGPTLRVTVAGQL
jgi:hypothetical protein